MSLSTRKYANDTELTSSYPWGWYVRGRALCPDGKVRALSRIAPTADMFFSVPAAVKAHGKTVSGFITVETLGGYSTETPDDPAVVRFVPVKSGKNCHVFDSSREG